MNLIDFTKIIVTGIIYRSNKRFCYQFENNASGKIQAFGINLYNGSIWGLTKENKRKLIKRISN